MNNKHILRKKSLKKRIVDVLILLPSFFHKKKIIFCSPFVLYHLFDVFYLFSVVLLFITNI